MWGGSACSNDMYVANVNSGASCVCPVAVIKPMSRRAMPMTNAPGMMRAAMRVDFVAEIFQTKPTAKRIFSITERMESLRDALLEKPSKLSTIPHAPQFLSGQLNKGIDAETSDITYRVTRAPVRFRGRPNLCRLVL